MDLALWRRAAVGFCFVFFKGRSWLGKAIGAAARAPSWDLSTEILGTDLGQKKPSLAKFPSPSAVASGDAEPLVGSVLITTLKDLCKKDELIQVTQTERNTGYFSRLT